MNDQRGTIPNNTLFPPQVLNYANSAAENGCYNSSDNNVPPQAQCAIRLNSAMNTTGYQFATQNTQQDFIGQDATSVPVYNLISLDGQPGSNEFESLAPLKSLVEYPRELYNAQPRAPIIKKEDEPQDWSQSLSCSAVDSDVNNFLLPPAMERKQLCMTAPNATPNVTSSVLRDLTPLMLWQEGFGSLDPVTPDPSVYNGIKHLYDIPTASSSTHLARPIHSVAPDNLGQFGCYEISQGNEYNSQNAQLPSSACDPSMQRHMNDSTIETPFEVNSATLQHTSANESGLARQFNGQIPRENHPEAQFCGMSSLAMHADLSSEHMMSTEHFKRVSAQLEETLNPSAYQNVPAVSSNFVYGLNFPTSISPTPQTVHQPAVPSIDPHVAQFLNVDRWGRQWEKSRVSTSPQVPTYSETCYTNYRVGAAEASISWAPLMKDDCGLGTADVPISKGIAQAPKAPCPSQLPDVSFTQSFSEQAEASQTTDWAQVKSKYTGVFNVNPNDGRRSKIHNPKPKSRRSKKEHSGNTSSLGIEKFQGGATGPFAEVAGSAPRLKESDVECKWGGGGCIEKIKGGTMASYTRHLQQYHLKDLTSTSETETPEASSESLKMKYNPKMLVKCLWDGCQEEIGLESLSRHIGTTHVNTLRTVCPLCQRTFSRSDAYKRHMVALDPNNPSVVICPSVLHGPGPKNVSADNKRKPSGVYGTSDEDGRPYKKQRDC